MPQDSSRYDPRFWHNIQSPQEMDVSRHFEYEEENIFQLTKWLRLDEQGSKKIVEVGCGSGYFTEKLTKMATVQAEIVAIEPDDALREYAIEKLSTMVRFLKGTAEEIPLPDESADLTVCHVVLNNLPDIHAALSEMTRITKPGGIVAAVEPGGGGIDYYPDPRLNELERKVAEAYGKAVWDLRSKLIDYSKDLKQKRARYAEAFHSCGLTQVEAHGVLSVFLLSDPRRELREVHGWLKKRLILHEKEWNRVEEILQRGGLPDSLIVEYYNAKKTYLKNLIQHPEQISQTHELHTVSRTVTIGIKPVEDSARV